MASKRGEPEAHLRGRRVGRDRRRLLQTLREEAGELDSAISSGESQLARLRKLRNIKEVQIGILTHPLTSPLQQQVEPVKDAANWTELADDDGLQYFYNSSTGASSWDMPDELKKGSDTPSADEASDEETETPSQEQLSRGEYDSPPPSRDSSDVDEEGPAPAAPCKKALPELQYPRLSSKRHASVSAMGSPCQKQSWGSYDSPPITYNRFSLGVSEEAPAPAAPRKAPPVLKPRHPQPRAPLKRHAPISATLPTPKRHAADSPPDSPVSSWSLDDYSVDEEAGPPKLSLAAFDHAAAANKYGPAAWQSPFPWSSTMPYGLAPPPYPSPISRVGAYPYDSPYSPLNLMSEFGPLSLPPIYPELPLRPRALGPVPPHLPLAPPQAPRYS